MSEQSLDITWKSIARVLITGFTLYILFLTRDVVIWFFFALVISILLEPAITFLRWLRLPRIIAVALVYISIFGILGLVIYLTAPIFIFEINQLSQNMPMYFEKLNPILKNFGINVAQNFQEFTANLTNALKDSSDGILRAVTTLFGGFYATSLIFTLAFFISLEKKGAQRVLGLLIPQKFEGQMTALFERAQSKVAGWFGARLLSCVFVGIASFIVFFVIGIKFSFILALISGVMNFIPYIGPTTTLILAVLFVGVSNSWMAAFYVFIALLIIQEIENKVFTPLIMKKFIDLPPVLVLLSLLMGGVLFGFLGTLFAVPVFGIFYEFTKEFLHKRREEVTY